MTTLMILDQESPDLGYGIGECVPRFLWLDKNTLNVPLSRIDFYSRKYSMKLESNWRINSETHQNISKGLSADLNYGPWYRTKIIKPLMNLFKINLLLSLSFLTQAVDNRG